ncbi:MAG: hypothetical protein BWZ10_01161 [candidate division BRC1 bacterium ADurb.BinA364]|nr:MAG: hypothetical protein BWZ10_01161 [candidate division BRC1 bacterium ADurb.BinA364]
MLYGHAERASFAGAKTKDKDHGKLLDRANRRAGVVFSAARGFARPARSATADSARLRTPGRRSGDRPVLCLAGGRLAERRRRQQGSPRLDPCAIAGRRNGPLSPAFGQRRVRRSSLRTSPPRFSWSPEPLARISRSGPCRQPRALAPARGAAGLRSKIPELVRARIGSDLCHRQRNGQYLGRQPCGGNAVWL